MQFIHDNGIIPAPPSAHGKSAQQAELLFLAQLIGLGLLFTIGISLLFINPFNVLDKYLSTNFVETLSGPTGESYRLSLQYGLALVLLSITPFVFYFSLRHHLSRPHQWRTHCAQCQSESLQRQHRTKWDFNFGRIMNLPFLRFSCNDCDWRGRRIDHGLL